MLVCVGECVNGSMGVSLGVGEGLWVCECGCGCECGYKYRGGWMFNVGMRRNYVDVDMGEGEEDFVCLLFAVLATSKVISGRVPTCDNAHSWRL